MSQAEALFAKFLADFADVERPPSAEFEALCTAHPSLSNALRQLESDWDRYQSLAKGAGPRARVDSHERSPLSEQLRSQFGQDVDPGVALGGKTPEPDSGPSSELLERLRAHAPSNSRYQLLGEVGRGGMGAVLKIWDEDLRRTLAMKVVLGKDDAAKPGDTPSVDAQTLGRFLEEAQITGQLDHPGIVPVHELGLGADGRVYFTMRLVKGEDLRKIFDHVRTGHDGWNPTRALTVLLKVCDAMSYAHDKGVIHRDLKPANVMVGKYGEVYVMDWGLARVLGQKDQHDVRVKPQPASSASVRTERRSERDETPDSPLVTMDGDVVGTPAYMSPEQARGDLPSLGPHSDVYAVGALLYHLIGGEAPYMPRDARVNQYAIWQRVQEGPPRPLVELAPRAPAELVSICEKAMERDATKRYRDMPALADDLRAYLERRVVRAYESGTWAETKKWVQRNKPLTASIGAAVLVLIAGIVANSVTRAELAATKTETGRLLDSARLRERKSRILGLIPELAYFETLDDDVYAHARNQSEPASKWWLERASRLVSGVPEDPQHPEAHRPGLHDVEAELTKLRARARTRTAEEVALDRATHPRAREFAALEARANWYGRMLKDAPWPETAAVEAKLAQAGWPESAEKLNDAAWQRVNPDSLQLGLETEAVLLANRAVAADPTRPKYRAAFAWALLRTGQLDEALAEEHRAVNEASTPLAPPSARTAESTPSERATSEADVTTLRANLTRLEREVADWREPNHAARRIELESMRRDLATLDHELDQQRMCRFVDSKDNWWHGELVKLVEGLERVSTRLKFARASLDDAGAQWAWRDAIEQIAASEKYRGTKWPSGERLTPQLGLVPIGPDPDSGLWEFAHLATGNPARRGADKKLEPEAGMGLVLVLLPAGKVPVANSQDRKQDSSIAGFELDAFFLSKYEMTVAQWTRIEGWQRNHDEARNSLRPATDLSWDDCQIALVRTSGWLQLPTEAQWEYACRATTPTMWWTGDDVEKLGKAANIGKRFSSVTTIGLLKPNAFGLHDVHGNVWEWCRDAHRSSDDLVRRFGDGLYDEEGAEHRVIRGGAYGGVPEDARSSYWRVTTPDDRFFDIGLRPARGVTP